LLRIDAPDELWRRPGSRRVAEFLGYEAFVPFGSAVAAPLLAAAAGRLDSVGGATDGRPGEAPAGADAVVALAEGAFVVVRDDAGSATPEPVAKGAVRGVTSRRGRTEVRVDVDGVGLVTALGPVGSRWQPGDVVLLTVDPDAVTLLP
jgi:thiamine transport system ATP-binding protein